MTFLAGPNGSSDHIYVGTFDGSQEGPVASFDVTAPSDTPPVVTASNFQMASGQSSVAASSLFTASDPDGDTITRYAVFDATPGSGHFVVDGTAKPSGVSGFYVTPQQYQTMTFVAGPTGGSDHIYAGAFDGSQEGPVADFHVAAPVASSAPQPVGSPPAVDLLGQYLASSFAPSDLANGDMAATNPAGSTPDHASFLTSPSVWR
jgi:hypothetical protein